MPKKIETIVKVQKPEKKTDYEFIAQIVIVVVLALLLVYNFGKITAKGANIDGNAVPGISSVSASEIIPTGTPRIYGAELKISYDYVNAQNQNLADSTINVLGYLDTSINLEGAELQKYISIGSLISCEYCCGAESIIFPNGQAACGCAHSYAMRGLAKYLIKYHGTEFTNDEILEELGKWKVLFFPGIHQTKAAVLKSKGIELNYINLASNKYRGIEQGASASGGMVGGC